MARRPDHMIDVLSRTRELLARSQGSDWAALAPADVIAILDGELQSLTEHGRLRDGPKLASLFAPTGEIQEISTANRWSDEYLELSSRFDAAIEEFT